MPRSTFYSCSLRLPISITIGWNGALGGPALGILVMWQNFIFIKEIHVNLLLLMWIKNIHDRSPFSLFIHALFCTMSGNKVMFAISEGNFNFLLCSKNLRRDLCWRHCKYKEWVSFFLGSWEMNRSAEQTNRTRTASRFTRFVCSALRFISHEPRKKDTHSLNYMQDVCNLLNKP